MIVNPVKRRSELHPPISPITPIRESGKNGSPPSPNPFFSPPRREERKEGPAVGYRLPSIVYPVAPPITPIREFGKSGFGFLNTKAPRHEGESGIPDSPPWHEDTESRDVSAATIASFRVAKAAKTGTEFSRNPK
jgi:hypothetical protein